MFLSVWLWYRSNNTIYSKSKSMHEIRLENLTYFYDSRKCDGLDRINFHLEPGQLCALLGPSGSGKTTLLKLMAKELTAQKGQYLNSLNGTTALYLPFENTYAHTEPEMTLIQYLSQNNVNINEDSIRDQISFLELSDEFYSSLKSLSLGQWHRAQLAKFFFTDATLLLLDEPFIHLDPSRRQFIADSLLRLAKENNKIVCWSTHFLDDALMLADKVLILQHGVQQQFSTTKDAFWAPANLFVAQYFGENNLVMATPSHQLNQSPQQFIEMETAIGKIPVLTSLDHNTSKEVILMCRPHLCQVELITDENDSLEDFNQSKSWKMFLKKISFFGAYQRLEFYDQHRTWWVDLATQPLSKDSPTQNFQLDVAYWVKVPHSAWSILKSY